jgi:hypothetical protein
MLISWLQLLLVTRIVLELEDGLLETNSVTLDFGVIVRLDFSSSTLLFIFIFSYIHSLSSSCSLLRMVTIPVVRQHIASIFKSTTRGISLQPTRFGEQPLVPGYKSPCHQVTTETTSFGQMSFSGE